MTIFEKAAYTVAGVALLLIGGLGASHWLANTVPSRPKGVAANAVFLWAPAVGFPGGLPRRGSWLSCNDGATANRCKLSEIGGSPEYEGDFVPYRHKGPLPADQLRIDPEKTRQQAIWMGNVWVPIIYLENGEILIPASKYEEGERLLEKLPPSQ